MPMTVDEQVAQNMLDPHTKAQFVKPVMLRPCAHTVSLATAQTFHGFANEHTSNQKSINPCLVCKKPVTGCLPNSALRVFLGEESF